MGTEKTTASACACPKCGRLSQKIASLKSDRKINPSIRSLFEPPIKPRYSYHDGYTGSFEAWFFAMSTLNFFPLLGATIEIGRGGANPFYVVGFIIAMNAIPPVLYKLWKWLVSDSDPEKRREAEKVYKAKVSKYNLANIRYNQTKYCPECNIIFGSCGNCTA